MPDQVAEFQMVSSYSVKNTGAPTIRLKTVGKRETFMTANNRVLALNAETMRTELVACGDLKPGMALLLARGLPRRHVDNRIVIPQNVHENYKGSGKKALQLTDALDADFGFGRMLGAIASDGWASDHTVSLAKADEKIQAEFTLQMRRLVPALAETTSARQVLHIVEIMGLKAISTKMTYNSVKAARLIEAWFGRRAANKRLPRFLPTLPSDCLWGVFSGLLDGDGSVALNNGVSRKTPSTTCAYTTISPQLVCDIEVLCRLIGIRCSTLKTPKAYVVSFSLIDVYRNRDRIRLLQPNKNAALSGMPRPTVDNRDVVPCPTSVIDHIHRLCKRRLLQWNPSELSTRKRTNRLRRDVAMQVSRVIIEYSCDDPVIRRWCGLVENVEIGWDNVESIEEKHSDGSIFNITTISNLLVLGNGLVVESSPDSDTEPNPPGS